MIHEFSGFTFDEEKRTISSSKGIVELSPKPYSMLLLLVKANGDIVSKQKIYETVWNNRVVSDTTVYKVIEKLRNILECNHDDVVIQNIHGVGYKLNISNANTKKSHKGIIAFLVMILMLVMGLFILKEVKQHAQSGHSYDYIEVNFTQGGSHHDLYGIQQLIKDFLFASFAHVKDQNQTPTSNSLGGRVLHVQHSLKYENKSIFMEIHVFSDNELVDEFEIKEASMDKIFDAYVKVIRNSKYLKQIVSTQNRAGRPFIKSKSIPEYISGLNAFHNQKHADVIKIMQQIHSSEPEFGWPLLYYLISKRKNGEIIASSSYLSEAKDTYEKGYLTTRFYLASAFNYLTVGRLRDAEDYFFLALRLGKKYGDHETLFEALSALGYNYLEQNRMELSLQYMEQALDLATKINNNRLLGDINSRLCYLFHVKKEFYTAIQYCERSIEEWKGYDMNIDISRIYLKTASIYLQTGNIEKAKALRDQSKDLVYTSNSYNRINQYLRVSALIAYESKNREELERVVQAYSKHIDEFKHPFSKIYEYETMAWLKMLENEYELAINYFDKYYHLSDEYSKNHAKQNALEGKFECAIKAQNYNLASQILIDLKNIYLSPDDPTVIYYSSLLPGKAPSNEDLLTAQEKAKDSGDFKLAEKLQLKLLSNTKS